MKKKSAAAAAAAAKKEEDLVLPSDFLDIIAEGLKAGIDEAIEDFKDPNGEWTRSKDAIDFSNRVSWKIKNR